MNNPFDDYKEKVNYDYILEAEMKIEYESDDRTCEEQEQEVAESIEKGIDDLINNEDYMHESFEELGIGRVYARCDEVSDIIKVTFGLSTIDATEPFTLKDLIEGAKEFMYTLDSNVDYESSTMGCTIPGTYPDDDVDDSEEIDPAFITFKMKGKRDDIKVNVIKQPIDESKLIDIDRRLVTEGKICLRNENDICEYRLNDDGLVEQYLNENLIYSFTFSKTGILNECKELMNEGYLLEDNESEKVLQDFNAEETEQNLEQGIEKVDQLQKLKDELVNKVDTLVNESNTEKWVIKNTKINKYLSAKDEYDFYYTNDISNAKIFNSYKDVFDYIEKQSKFGNNGAENWEEERLVESNNITEEFPSTDFTNKILNNTEILNLNLEDNLTDEQKQWIIKYLGSLEEFKESFIFLTSLINSSEEILSIDEYVNRLLKSTNF